MLPSQERPCFTENVSYNHNRVSLFSVKVHRVSLFTDVTVTLVSYAGSTANPKQVISADFGIPSGEVKYFIV